MGFADWLDIPFLKIVSQHTSSVLGVLASVVLVSRSVQWVLGPGLPKTFVEYGEHAVLLILSLYLLIRLFYDLWEELRSRGRKH
jgi:hypothetical protein